MFPSCLGQSLGLGGLFSPTDCASGSDCTQASLNIWIHVQFPRVLHLLLLQSSQQQLTGHIRDRQDFLGSCCSGWKSLCPQQVAQQHPSWALPCSLTGPVQSSLLYPSLVSSSQTAPSPFPTCSLFPHRFFSDTKSCLKDTSTHLPSPGSCFMDKHFPLWLTILRKDLLY